MRVYLRCEVLVTAVIKVPALSVSLRRMNFYPLDHVRQTEP